MLVIVIVVVMMMIVSSSTDGMSAIAARADVLHSLERITLWVLGGVVDLEV